MSMLSLMNCTEPSHNRKRPPFGWSLRKFERLPISGFAVARRVGLTLPSLAFPTAVSDRLIGGPPTPEAHVLRHVLKALVTKAAPVPPGGPPKSAKVSVTGFLLSCSIVQAPFPAVSTNWAATELFVLFTNWSLTRTWTQTGWGAPAAVAGTPSAAIAAGIGDGHVGAVRQ